jgi:hypothetical protein
MNDLDLIKLELEVQGITCKGPSTFHFMDGNVDADLRADDLITLLNMDTKKYKGLFFEVWKDLVSYLKSPGSGVGNESTQRMFANSLKILSGYTERFPVLRSYRQILKAYLSHDSESFDERFMSEVIEKQIALDWINHLVRLNRFRLQLVRAFLKESLAKSVVAQSAGVSGPWSNLDLPMRERVWEWSEDDVDFRNESVNRQKALRHQLPETYNKPLEFEEGFVWRELRNEPYSFDDEEENPYPGRSLLRRP